MNFKQLYINSRFSVWWHHIIAPLTIGLFITFFLDNKINYFLLITFLISSFFSALCGYLINDFFDQKQDKKVNKTNFFHNISFTSSIIIIALLILVMLASWFFVPIENNFKYIIVLSQLLLFFLYSTPQTRFKENPILGVITDATYAKILPWLMLALINTLFTKTISLILLFFWLLPYGVRSILAHQIDDYYKDLKSTNTFVTKHQQSFAKTIIKKTVYIEIVFFSTLLIISVVYVETIWYQLSITLAIILSLLYNLKQYKNQQKKIHLSQVLNDFYEYLLPFSLSIGLSIYTKQYYFFILHLFLFPKVLNYLREIVKRKNKLSFSKIKLWGNYLIYYLFLFFGINLKNEKKSALDYIKDKFKK